MATNNELIQLNSFLRSGKLDTVQVCYKTFLALSKVKKQVGDILQPVVETQEKFIAEAQADENYQNFIKDQNELRKKEASLEELVRYQNQNKHLLEDQIKRDEEWKGVLNSDSGIELNKLTEVDHPDLYNLTLPASEWEALSIILDTD